MLTAINFLKIIGSHGQITYLPQSLKVKIITVSITSRGPHSQMISSSTARRFSKIFPSQCLCPVANVCHLQTVSDYRGFN